MQPTLDPKWFDDHDNVVILAHYLADHGSTATQVAYAVEKPWKFQEEFEAALEEIDPDIP